MVVSGQFDATAALTPGTYSIEGWASPIISLDLMVER
jgi:hypothetical protein